MPTVETTLDTQNEVLEIATTSSEDSIVAVYLDGDFSAGNVEVGRKNTAGTFFPISGATKSIDDDFKVEVGRDRRLFARATGATPDVNVETNIIS